MKTVNVHGATTELSRLLTEVEAGGEVIIARDGTPVARMVPYNRSPQKMRMPGRWKGRFTVPDSALDTLSSEELGYWDERPPLSGFSE